MRSRRRLLLQALFVLAGAVAEEPVGAPSAAPSLASPPTPLSLRISRWFTPYDPLAVFRQQQCYPAQTPLDFTLDRSEAAPEVDDVFESFEEWKRRQAEETPDPPAVVENVSAESNDSQPTEPLRPASNDSASNSTSTPPKNDTDAVPAKLRPAGPHRYNYASPDCSARVLASSPQTQHASSLLHKSRDRYMLTPCRAEQHWVVVELCDEIRVEAVELAVWEFFSGVVRGVRVSVGDDADGTEWTAVGEFVGKNVRGVQTFTLPEPTSFHRFLRLDFPSFYGTEYYCPVSQLKVYGMNQMEAFKMEQRRAAAASDAQAEKAREKEREAARVLEQERSVAAQIEQEREKEEHEEEIRRERELCELEKLVQAQARRAGAEEHVLFEETPAVCAAPSSRAAAATSAAVASKALEEPLQVSNGSASNGSALNGSVSVPPPQQEAPSASYRVAQRTNTSESIYAYIIRRLNALEGNSTLVARYIDEQAKALRASLARTERTHELRRQAAAEEEAVRWDTERIRAEERLSRLSRQMESLKASIDADRRSMEAQFRVLADELGFERRRSLAQLIVLVSVVVLGVVTRGTTIDALLRPLAAEVLRRSDKDRHAKRLSTGPLAGLLIDIPQPSNAPTPQPHSPTPLPRSPLSPTWPHSPLSQRGKRRPTTPGTLRRRLPAQRSVSVGVGVGVGVDPGFDDDPLATRLPAINHKRRLARSSHLHTMRRREDTSASEAERVEWATEDASASEVDEAVRASSPERGCVSDSARGEPGRSPLARWPGRNGYESSPSPTKGEAYAPSKAAGYSPPTAAGYSSSPSRSSPTKLAFASSPLPPGRLTPLAPHTPHTDIQRTPRVPSASPDLI